MNDQVQRIIRTGKRVDSASLADVDIPLSAVSAMERSEPAAVDQGEPRPGRRIAATTHRPYLPPLRVPVRRIGARTFDFGRQVAVMAVVNRTPDSFFDRGRTFALDAAVAAAFAASRRGRTGSTSGDPFAPGAAILVEELDRVLPVIAALRAGSDAVISVDTFHAEVAKRAMLGGQALSTTRPA